MTNRDGGYHRRTMPERDGATPGRHGHRPTARSQRGARAGRVAALVLTAAVSAAAAPTALLASTGLQAAATTATAAQDETTSTLADEDGPATTTDDLLNGPTTVPTTAASSTTVVPAVPDGSADNDDTRKVWAIVIGLVAVAVALSVLTIGYWRRTRPTGEAADPIGHDDRQGDLADDERDLVGGGGAERQGAPRRPPNPAPRPPRPAPARRPSAGATSATVGRPDTERQRPIRARPRDDAER